MHAELGGTGHPFESQLKDGQLCVPERTPPRKRSMELMRSSSVDSPKQRSLLECFILCAEIRDLVGRRRMRERERERERERRGIEVRNCEAL